MACFFLQTYGLGEQKTLVKTKIYNMS